MPQFMSLHRAPGLLPENWDDNSVGVYASKRVKIVQAYVNLGVGFIFSVWETDSQDTLIEQLEEWGLPYDEIHEVQFSQNYDQMVARLQQLGRI
jgi:hypothetical protein